jgi:phospholipid/cholesterol/gamma-HCH transport system substrate-binding protein
MNLSTLGSSSLRRAAATATLLLVVFMVSSCGSARDFRGLNSFPLPGTEGRGPGSFTVQAQMPDVQTLQQNSAVKLNDVTVGNVTKIEVQGWHALLTMKLNGDVDLPANATATLAQTSLLGTLHVELSPPKDAPPQGRLRDGSLIPLSSAGAYPSTENTLAAVSMLLNGGALGKIQDVTTALSTALKGREQDARSLIGQLDAFAGYLNDQKDDILRALDSLNNLTGQIADQKPVVDRALKTLPDALGVLRDERDNIADAIDQLGKFSALAADSADQTKQNLAEELNDLGPVLQSLADAGPALTRSLTLLSTFPFPKDTILNTIRGDYANLTGVADLTLSRLDSSFFVGTRWEGNLTELEMQWGRTIGQIPSPYTAGNPLIAPYRFDQGP